MKTLVIGGGMAGLTYAIMSAKNGIETVVCEKNARVGKKIAVTGNGKCNIGNINASAECFNNSALVAAVLQSVPVETYRDFLSACGIVTFCDGVGRMYPLSESAASVVDCLRFNVEKYGGKILCDVVADKIVKSKGGYNVCLNGKVEFFDKVVLACGSASGSAQPVVPQDVAKLYTPLSPSLVPVKVKNMDKTLNGLRAKADACLIKNGKVVAKESGEVQFKDYGLSGICIYNLSAYIARDIVLKNSAQYKIQLDLVPQLSEPELVSILSARIPDGVDKAFLSILHSKLAQHVSKNNSTAAQLAYAAKHVQFDVEKLLDYSMSQVTCGGVDEKNINLKDLTTADGITVIGEMLNADGLCGGNNLYFAAASAIYTFSEQQREKAFEN